MLLVLFWAFPIFFIVLYYLNFDRWYMRDADLQKLAELVASRRQAEDR